jgi:hypothetical protein
MKTLLASESRRMCSRHPERPATALRQSVEQARGPKYTVTRRECAECAGRTLKPLETRLLLK